MRRSTEKILTTHVGALPGPPDAWGGEQVSDERLRGVVADVVGQQRRAGVDIVNEGELTKGGNWVAFINSRLSGFESMPAEGTLKLLRSSRDWAEFEDFYAKAMAGGTLFEQTASAPVQTSRIVDWRCTGPIRYTGQTALAREIGLLREALGDSPVGDAFLTTTAPASVEVGRRNEHYESERDFLYGLADALKVEYEAIAAAGLLVQVDDAWLPALWDRIGIGMGKEAYKRYCMQRVEVLNHALQNVPEEQTRYHLCWGSWHGPHAHDIPMADLVDVMLAVKAQTYLFEAANARHEHEYTLWETVKLPAGKILAPGVVTHSTPLVEHPELVSQRIQRFAKIVGRENVIASTDCGLGLRCHAQIAWAKLRSLAEGAALASRALGFRS
jgi:5-methyltetrahydropteroyltriglutamate--homocysteine methyltransferase